MIHLIEVLHANTSLCLLCLRQVRVYHEKDLVEGCPFSVRAVPLISLQPRPSGIDPCALGSTVEVLVSENGDRIDVLCW